MHKKDIHCLGFLFHTVNKSQGPASCKETLANFKREIGGQINEIRKLISEDERLIADKYSQVSSNMI